MKFRVREKSEVSAGQVSTRCPHCGREAVLDQIGQDIHIGDKVVCGQRRCPDPDCSGHLFIVVRQGKLIASYPPVRIDFDSENIPKEVVRTFEETLDCHATGCFIAAAIMVRRTLEEICAEREAQGQTLKARLKDLGSRIVLPKELLDAMDELRLLGNDAAHVKAQTFSKIAKEELDVAIEFTKEILKALYQYSALLERLRQLKSTDSA